MYGTDRKVEQAFVLTSPRSSRSNQRPGRMTRTLLLAVVVTAGIPVAAGLRDVNHSLFTAVCQGNLATAAANDTTPAPANSTTDFDWLSVSQSPRSLFTSTSLARAVKDAAPVVTGNCHFMRRFEGR